MPCKIVASKSKWPAILRITYSERIKSCRILHFKSLNYWGWTWKYICAHSNPKDPICLLVEKVLCFFINTSKDPFKLSWIVNFVEIWEIRFSSKMILDIVSESYKIFAIKPVIATAFCVWLEKLWMVWNYYYSECALPTSLTRAPIISKSISML